MKLYTEAEFTFILNACIANLEAAKRKDLTLNEREKCIQGVQATMALLRRYITAFRTRALNPEPPTSA